MSTDDFLSPSDVFKLARQVARPYRRQGHDVQNDPAFSDALYGYVKAKKKFDEDPARRRRDYVARCMYNETIEGCRQRSRYYRKSPISLDYMVVEVGLQVQSQEEPFARTDAMDLWEWVQATAPRLGIDKRLLGWLMESYGHGGVLKEIAARENVPYRTLVRWCREAMEELRQTYKKEVDSGALLTAG